MPDLTTIPDDQLLQMIKQQGGAQAPPSPLSSMSNAGLKAAIKQAAAAQNAANIAASKADLAANPAPDSEGVVGYAGGVAQSFKDLGGDIATGAKVFGQSAKELPGKLAAGFDQLGDAAVTQDIGTFAPPGTDTRPMTGMSQPAAKTSLAEGTGLPAVGRAIKEAVSPTGRPLEQQYIDAFKANPAMTTLNTALTLEGVRGGLMHAPDHLIGIADGLDARAAEASSAGNTDRAAHLSRLADHTRTAAEALANPEQADLDTAGKVVATGHDLTPAAGLSDDELRQMIYDREGQTSATPISSQGTPKPSPRQIPQASIGETPIKNAVQNVQGSDTLPPSESPAATSGNVNGDVPPSVPPVAPSTPLTINGKAPWEIPQADFVKAAPKADGINPAPTVEHFTKPTSVSVGIGEGEPGVSIEPETMNSGTRIHGMANVVYRSSEGKPVGVLQIFHDDAGNVDLQSVAVDPAFRRQGIGTALYKAASDAGFNVEDAAGHDGLTPDGARFLHARSVAQAVADGKAVPPKVLEDYPSLSTGIKPADFFTDESGAVNMQPLINAVNAVAEAAREAKANTTGGAFRSTAAMDQKTADAMMRLGSSKEGAEGYALMQDRHVRGGLKPPQATLLNKYFDDQRAQAFERAGTPYNTGAIPKLTTAEAAEIAADPEVQAAIAKHRAGPQKYIEQMRQYVSPGMRKPGGLTSTPDDAFLSLLATRDAAGKEIGQGVGPGGAAPPVDTRLAGTRFAKQATGTGQEYNPDYGARLQKSVVEVTKKANTRAVVKAMLAARDTTSPPPTDPAALAKWTKDKGYKLAHTAIETIAEQDPASGKMVMVTNQRGKLPGTITYGGVEHPAQEIDTGIVQRRVVKNADGSTTVKQVKLKMAVPKSVAEDFHRALNPSEGPLDKAGPGIHKTIASLGNTATGLALASPTEAVFHIGRQLTAASRIPAIKAGLLRRGIQTIVPQAEMLHRILSVDMSDIKNLNTWQRINESGGGSVRPFQEQVDKGLVSKIPILKDLAHYQHDLLFGAPSGKGLGALLKPGKFGGTGGFDARLRVAMENLRSEIEGNTDTRRTGEFLRQFGQYGSVRDPFINAIRPLNPFSATTFPLRLTEFRQMFGGTGLKTGNPRVQAMIRANTLSNMIVSAFVTHYLLNKLLSGQWPHENDKNHMYDIAVKMPDESMQYVPYRMVDPPGARAMNTFGIPDDAEDFRNGSMAFGSVANNAGRGVYNGFGSAVNSPLATSTATLLTGHSPFYMTRGMQPIKTAIDPKDPVSRAEAAAANMNGISAMIYQYFANRSGQ